MLTLKVQDLQKSFDAKTVFSGVNFIHHRGALGISGSNGSGKTTLVKCLAGLLKPTSGEILRLKNDSTLSLETFKKNLGYVAPYINLYSELTCRENLAFIAKLRGYSQNESRRRIEYRLNMVKLDKQADQPFGKLSTGQQQRLRLASGLMPNPGVLILDEPGSNLDEAGHTIIQQIVDTYVSEGKTVVLASNNERELSLCGRIYSMEQENIIKS